MQAFFGGSVHREKPADSVKGTEQQSHTLNPGKEPKAKYMLHDFSYLTLLIAPLSVT